METVSNPTVFFDIAIGGRPIGRMIMVLRSDIVPRTAGGDEFILEVICL
jgi:hypothetical protein